MPAADLEATIRRILPALGLDPASFALDRGFLARARRSGKPRPLALKSLATQFVFVGTRLTPDPDAIADRVADEAVTALAPNARAACQRLAIGWSDAEGRFFAAVFLLSEQGKPTDLVARSWSAPEDWPEPMIDVSRPPDESIALALDRLGSIVDTRKNQEPPFRTRFDRAVKLVDVVLRRFQGEGPDTSIALPESASDATWAGWFTGYSRSVRDEWKRVRGSASAELAARHPGKSGEDPGHAGASVRLRVFVSYARPQATTLAQPVERALRSLGAEVWFDQNASRMRRN